MFTRNTLRIVTGLLAPVLAGCGNYTVTFEVGDVINASGDDMSRTMLDVDIICLTKEEAERHPEIVNRTMLSDAWFKARDTDYAMISDIKPGHIYALRRGETNPRDTLKGEPLLSGRDLTEGASRTRTVSIRHSGALGGGAAIVIYGRFTTGAGVARLAPLVIKPPGDRGKDIHVAVGRQNMRLDSPD
jgi:hypothetical protein